MTRQIACAAARTTYQVAVCFLTATVVLRGEIIDRVLAVVSGEIILQSDVAAAQELGLVQMSKGAADDGRRQVLSRLIDRALILAEVDRYAPPEPEAATVDRELLAVRERFASRDAFEQALTRSGITEEHLRGTLREDLRIRAYLEQRFTFASFSEAELLQYYRDHPEEFARAGTPEPFDRVRADVGTALAAARRRSTVNEWVTGLRRRAEVIDLYGR